MLELLGPRLTGVALPSSPDLFTLAPLGPWSRLDHHTFEIRDADSILATSGKFIADARSRGVFRCALGRAIEWTRMINPLPQQPSLTLDATLARQALGWRSRRNAGQTIA
jgi:hypothetical protein